MSGMDGPTVRLDLSCFQCRFQRSESYRVQGDSGHDVYCDHPTIARRLGISWTTPPDCPFLTPGLKALYGHGGLRLSAAEASAFLADSAAEGNTIALPGLGRSTAKGCEP